MRIHVLGVTGMLGTYVSKYLKLRKYEVCDYDRSTLDVLNFNKDKWCDNISAGDVIINCIGLLKPNILSYEHAITVNHNFPIILDSIGIEKGCKIVNFSSDCVYSGIKGSYTENDPCDATDWYGLTKQHKSLQSTVLRLSFIGEERYNKKGLLEFALKNKTVQGYANCWWNGLTGLEIAKILDRMIRGDGITFWSGVRNVFSDTPVSKYTLLEMINEIYDLNLTIVRVDAKSITNTVIDETLDRTLDTIYPRISVPKLYNMIQEQKNFIYEY